MSHVHFAAWGSVDIEQLDRMQRRKYIKNTRELLAKHGIELECGGQKDRPYYAIKKADTTYANNDTADAFRKVMQKALEWIPAEVIAEQ